jgi:hypothetical protein
VPIETRWFLENRVSFTRLFGVVQDADLKAMDAWLNACMNNSPERLVHHIIDARDITKPTSVRQAMQLTAPRHPRIGWAITIGATRNPMVRFLTALVVSAARLRYRDVTTLEEALAQFKILDPSLPDLEPYRHIAEARPSQQSGS